jgi:hypothetical protein
MFILKQYFIPNLGMKIKILNPVEQKFRERRGLCHGLEKSGRFP